jgi:hypothetical protein
MNLQQTFDELVARGLIKDSRVGPIGTALRQYAVLLGYETPNQCPPEAFNKPQAARSNLINRGAPANLSRSALRNLKNNVSFVVRLAAEQNLIAPPVDTLGDWNERRIQDRLPARNESVPMKPYYLRHGPPAFQKEIEDYSEWSTGPYASNRHKDIKKRPTSMEAHKRAIWRLAGYIVNVKGVPAEQISLTEICKKRHVEDFVVWYTGIHGRVTRTVTDNLQKVRVIPTHYLVALAKRLPDDAQMEEALAEARALADGITEVLQGLDRAEAVHDKEAGGSRWVALDQIERAGVSRYPLHASRIKELCGDWRGEMKAVLSNVFDKEGSQGSLARYAVWAKQSLITRLLVRIPFRQRNIREMALGVHLVKEGGEWMICLRGKHLKVAWRGDVENEVKYAFPKDLVWLLEEYLTLWRPLLLPQLRIRMRELRDSMTSKGVARDVAESRVREMLLDPSHQLDDMPLFVTAIGTPMTQKMVNEAIRRVTYKFTGVAVNVHMLRTIWATEYISATKDLAGAAYKLGDTITTVLKHYAKLLKEDAEKNTTEWVMSRLGVSESKEPARISARRREAAQVGPDELRRLFELAKQGASFDEAMSQLQRAA